MAHGYGVMTQNPASEQTSPEVLPVRRGDRTVGAFVTEAGSVRYVPAVDLERLVLGGLVVAAAAVVGAAVGRGRRAAIGTVTMGPGGWISLKNANAAGLRPAAGRPWWARLLSAHRLVVDQR